MDGIIDVSVINSCRTLLKISFLLIILKLKLRLPTGANVLHQNTYIRITRCTFKNDTNI